MKKEKFIDDYTVGDIVHNTFMITEATFQTTKAGRDYISLKLSDKTGSMDAKKWNSTLSEYKFINIGKIYEVEGKVSSFNDNTQIIIENIKDYSDNYDVEDYVKVSNKNYKEMVDDLYTYYNNINTSEYKSLLKYFLSNKDIFDKFCLIPAGKIMHHNYAHGLLEHTVEVCKLSMSMVDLYKDIEEIDIDLLITGCILHDIAKIQTYDYGLCAELNEEGKNIGHIILCSIMIENASKELSISKEYVSKVLHLIASHHGKYEWGSPVTPKTKEAIILHYADNISSNINREINNLNGK